MLHRRPMRDQVQDMTSIGSTLRSAVGRAERGTSMLELAAVAVMSVTAVLTAWTGFQSAKWSGIMSLTLNTADAQRAESLRASTEASRDLQVDVAIFISWVDAVAAERSDLAAFTRDRFTDRLDLATTAWEATDPLVDDQAPATPFEMAEYTIPAASAAETLQRAAEASDIDARRANRQSDDYVVMSVLFATVLFFAALSTKLRGLISQRIMIVMACIGLVVGVMVIAGLPVEI